MHLHLLESGASGVSTLTKTRAIAIRLAPYSETSRIIQWVTEDHGKLATIAKGAMKPRSEMLGQFDLLYTCELVYYAKERDAVYVTRSCSPLETRPGFRTDWRAAMSAIYLADLTARVVPGHEPAPELFHLLESALNELHTRGWSVPVLFHYELRLLSLLGLAPRLDRCAICDKPFETGHRAFFSPQRGGMVCDRCDQSGNGHRASADVLSILNHWQRSSGWNTARTARCSDTQTTAIRKLLGDFLSFHLDLKTSARDIALNLLF